MKNGTKTNTKNMAKVGTNFLRNELERKILHVIHTFTVVGLIFTARYSTIIIIELLFLALVFAARKLRWFQGMQEVGRVSYGEFFMPVAFILLAAAGIDKWIFLAAVLHLAVADVAAALLGVAWGKRVYYVFGLKKTILGTAAFIFFSVAIGLFMVASGQFAFSYSWPLCICAVTAAATIAENTSPLGSDNLTIPLIVAAVFLAAA